MKQIKRSPTLLINEKVKAMWQDGEDILHVAFGESRFPVHPDLSKALNDGMSNRSYLSSLGTDSLRTKIAEYYTKQLNIDISYDQVIVGVGSKSLLYSIIQAIDGDILLPRPSWVSYSSIATMCNRSIKRFDLNKNNGYKLNIDSLKDAYSSAKNSGVNPSMLVLNSPNNPVGNSFEKSDIQSVANWAQENNITILSDEIYGLITFKENKHHTPLTYYPDKTIVFSGLSKHLSLGGWRLGISILPRNSFGQQLISKFESISGNIWSCVPSPFQIVGETAFSDNESIADYINVCTNIHRVRTLFIYEQFQDLGIDCPRPTGGFYIYASFKKWSDQLSKIDIISCTSLSEYLLDKYKIATLPGSAFGDDPENLCLRISSSYLDMETDESAQKILDIYNDGTDERSFINDHHPRLKLFISKMNDFLNTINK
tara:strand:+ start:2544 stop:3827 length:1284 start_codon:yes stop_codon:yes gene_type:complete